MSMEEGETSIGHGGGKGASSGRGRALAISFPFCQKIIAEVIGTFFLVFAGCGSVVVNLSTKGTVTFPGVCITWGLTVTALIYSLGHISGAHLNPAVTVAHAACFRFPWWEVPAYVSAQLLGATLASETLQLLFGGGPELFHGTVPAGSAVQSLVLEFIISFLLMFVISGVATDSKAIGQLAGLVVGSTVALNVFYSGPISGASMNPARSLGPAIVGRQFEGLWVYMVGPTAGMVAGAWVYNVIREKPHKEITTRLGENDDSS